MIEKAMTITYSFGESVYINLTNRCNNHCTFCERNLSSRLNGSDPLWLEHEPSAEEIIRSLRQWDFTQKREIVFCGYGEPTERLDTLLETASYIKEHIPVPIRINTNGLADLLWQKPVAPLFKGRIDCVSISLNSSNSAEYTRLCRPDYGERSFDALLAFARDCTAYVPKVVLSVVDVVTSPAEQEKCRRIAESIGAELRIRPYES